MNITRIFDYIVIKGGMVDAGIFDGSCIGSTLCCFLFYHHEVTYSNIPENGRKQVQQEQIMLDSLVVEQNRVKLQIDGIFTLFPFISGYLFQSTIILNNCLQIEDLKMVKAKEEQIQLLLSEIKTAPEELKNLVIDQYDINRKLTKIKQPIQTYLAEFKVKTMFAMAKTSLSLLEKLSSNCNKSETREEQLKFELVTICCEGS